MQEFLKMNETWKLQLKPKQFSFVEKLWSYLIPRRIEVSHTPYYLEVIYSRGILILNSLHANQSNDSLKNAFHYAFHQFGVYKRSYSKVLVLGLGLGSTIELLQTRVSLDDLSAYETDERIIYWLKKYYLFDFEIKNISADDAHNTRDKFDLILVDLFNDESMPDFLDNLEFWNSIIRRLNPHGIVIWNTLKKTEVNVALKKSNIFDSSFEVLLNRFYFRKKLEE